MRRKKLLTKTERAHKIIRDRKDRKQRIADLYAKLEMLRAMLKNEEDLRDEDLQFNQSTIRSLTARIRTVEQQIRYIGD